MIYKIIDLKAVKKTGLVYVLVHFWENRASGPPVLINDFYMALSDEDTRVVIEEEGGETYVTAESGVRSRVTANLVEDPGDPFVRETVKRDVPAQMRQNIEAYWQRAGGKVGDKTWPVKTRPELVAKDPAGVLDRTDVKDMKDKEFETTDVHA